jgi:8-oxo-dGTP pyrophosphatase MutT (NUDIX family)
MMQRHAAREARDRLIQRLVGSTPNSAMREFDARLAALIPAQPKAAAVLIGLTEAAGEPGVLLTVRSTALRQHAGQISFPGGTIEASDAGPAEAALREAQEEVGLSAEHAQVLGYLPDQLVLTGFRITPVIARIAPQFVPLLDRSEVQESFELPFEVLMDPDNHRDTTRRIGDIELAARDIQFGEHRIWGATAAMLLSLYELALP